MEVCASSRENLLKNNEVFGTSCQECVGVLPVQQVTDLETSISPTVKAPRESLHGVSQVNSRSCIGSVAREKNTRYVIFPSPFFSFPPLFSHPNDEAGMVRDGPTLVHQLLHISPILEAWEPWSVSGVWAGGYVMHPTEQEQGP